MIMKNNAKFDAIRAGIRHSSDCHNLVAPCDCGMQSAIDALNLLSATGKLGEAETPESRMIYKIEAMLASYGPIGVKVRMSGDYDGYRHNATVRVYTVRGNEETTIIGFTGYGDSAIDALENLAKYIGA